MHPIRRIQTCPSMILKKAAINGLTIELTLSRLHYRYFRSDSQRVSSLSFVIYWIPDRSIRDDDRGMYKQLWDTINNLLNPLYRVIGSFLYEQYKMMSYYKSTLYYQYFSIQYTSCLGWTVKPYRIFSIDLLDRSFSGLPVSWFLSEFLHFLFCFFVTFRANAVGKKCVCVFCNVFLDLLPITLVITYLFAICADRQQFFQRFYLR